MSKTRRQHPVTDHGRKRVRERLKLPARAVRRMAEKAWTEGQRLHELTLPVQHEIKVRQGRHDPGGRFTEPVVYRGFLFIFSKEYLTLITTYPLSYLEG